MLDQHRIFAHRGLWSDDVKGNSAEALFGALDRGFSLETDIRDHLGQVVVSHDPLAKGHDPMTLDALLRHQNSNSGYLALNVKSDGLIGIQGKIPEKAFFFDMSLPETLRYAKAELEIALRLSDLEPNLAPIGVTSNWLWIDAFVHDWFTDINLSDYESLKGVILVSPELHGRDKEAVWNFASENWERFQNLCICTDYPDEFLIRVRP